MARIKALAMMASLLLTPTVQTAAASTETLEPSSKWQMDYDIDSCWLARSFGEGTQQVTLIFTRYAPENGFDLALYGKRFAGNLPVVDITTDFGSTGSWQHGLGFHGISGKIPAVFASSRRLTVARAGKSLAPLPPVTPEQEAVISDVTIRVGHGKVFKVNLGSMGPPMQAMRACTDDLVRHWGFDLAVMSSLRHGPQPKSDPRGWLKSADYPNEAWRAGQNGIVRFRLDVDATGLVGGCHIQFPASPDDFAKQTCDKITSRARFDPALNSQGQPVKSYWASEVMWVMNGP